MKVTSKLEIIEKLYNHSFRQISYFQNDITKFKIFLSVIKNHQLNINQTIEELFFTENVWIRYEGKTLPIIPKTKSLQYKTSLNDKLINYTVDFDFAFDKINNVR